VPLAAFGALAAEAFGVLDADAFGALAAVVFGALAAVVFGALAAAAFGVLAAVAFGALAAVAFGALVARGMVIFPYGKGNSTILTDLQEGLPRGAQIRGRRNYQITVNGATVSLQFFPLAITPRWQLLE
jgi:hypothetical protein